MYGYIYTAIRCHVARLESPASYHMCLHRYKNIYMYMNVHVVVYVCVSVCMLGHHAHHEQARLSCCLATSPIRSCVCVRLYSSYECV